ncbi:MAG: proline--tRNA ligase [Deltaproteobacteria bacterium]|nr:proline--tRNA ligase [Deltaproteobacteria bacterium]
MGKTNAINPTRDQNYPQWYQEVVKASDMAERSPVRGCMVIKPWGYALWENMVKILDDMFKECGVKNAYFPLFIPVSFLEKEAKHVEGFATECAVVTHHRLEKKEDGSLAPAGELQEPLIVRPTSETIIGESFSRWIKSYRDLPVLINQWANVVRWEMRTRIFLRTTEFLWQEGHTAHLSKKEALEMTFKILDIYQKFATEYLAIPIIKGRKTEAEKFPGAEDTLCIEAMMSDKKALQAGTSHFLGQNFAKASNIKYQTINKTEEFVWTTSWGVSTRLIGGIIMTHGDDDGVIIPPRVAPSQIVLMPIFRQDAEKSRVLEYADNVATVLNKKYYCGRKIVVETDKRDIGGARGWEWIKKGIPIRIEIGPRDIEANSVFMARRDKKHSEKESINTEHFINNITDILDDIQKNIFQKAADFTKRNTVIIEDKKDFYKFFTPKNKKEPEIHGGFALSGWCGKQECEKAIKENLKVTIRCIPFDGENKKGKCICCGNPAEKQVIFAKAY